MAILSISIIISTALYAICWLNWVYPKKKEVKTIPRENNCDVLYKTSRGVQ